MATKIDGGFKSTNGTVYYYTTGVVMGLAVTLMDLNPAEHAAFRLCEIHAFGAPTTKLKSCLTRLSRAFIANNLACARSGGYRAVDSLIERRMLLLKGNGAIVINKWIDEWLDKQGNAVFYEGSTALNSILASLERTDWWQFPAAWFSRIAPVQKTKQIPFQSHPQDKANGVPSHGWDTNAPTNSHGQDKNGMEVSHGQDKYSCGWDNPGAQTPENGGETPDLERDGFRFGSALSGDGKSLTDVAAFAERNCWKGVEVCGQVLRFAPNFPHNHWVIAFQELANYPKPETLDSPTALVLARVKTPTRAKHQKPITLSRWLKQHGQPNSTKQKAAEEDAQASSDEAPSDRQDADDSEPELTEDQELADAFLQRPHGHQRQALSLLSDLQRLRLEYWLTHGRLDWRDQGGASGSTSVAVTLATAERALRYETVEEPPFL